MMTLSIKYELDIHAQSDQIMVSRGTFENRALPSLHGGLLEITHTVPFKIDLLLKTIKKCVIQG